MKDASVIAEGDVEGDVDLNNWGSLGNSPGPWSSEIRVL
jgi:hypothetical protein